MMDLGMESDEGKPEVGEEVRENHDGLSVAPVPFFGIAEDIFD